MLERVTRQPRPRVVGATVLMATLGLAGAWTLPALAEQAEAIEARTADVFWLLGTPSVGEVVAGA